MGLLQSTASCCFPQSSPLGFEEPSSNGFGFEDSSIGDTTFGGVVQNAVALSRVEKFGQIIFPIWECS